MTDQVKEDSIFQTPVTPSTETTADPMADLLKSITSTDGRQKYATPEAALKAMPEAQQHISTLEQELHALKEEKLAMQSKLESLGRVDQSLQNLATPPPEPNRPVSQGYDEDAVARLVQKQLEQREYAQTVLSNQRKVTEALVAKYGDKAQGQYEARARELGISQADFNHLAGMSPLAVLEYFQVKPVNAPKTPSGSFNTSNLQGHPSEKLTNPMLNGGNQKAYWADVKARVNAKHGIS